MTDSIMSQSFLFTAAAIAHRHESRPLHLLRLRFEPPPPDGVESVYCNRLQMADLESNGGNVDGGIGSRLA